MRARFGFARRHHAVSSVAAIVAAVLTTSNTLGHHDLFRRISAGAINGNGAFAAEYKAASANGTRAFFETLEPLVLADSDAQTDIYERAGGITRLVSVGSINGNGPYAAGLSLVSADGLRAIFVTPEQLVTADQDSAYDTYQRSEGVTTLISEGAINGDGPHSALAAGASADATRVFFLTQEQLVAGDMDAADDIYQRSGGVTTLLSDGAINGDGAFPVQFVGSSVDGTRIFFESAEKLVAADTDSSTDIYQRSGGTTTLLSAGAINGNLPFNADFAGASTDGTRVFFITEEKLVSSDTDNAYDVYRRSGTTTIRISAGVINGNGADFALFVGSSTDGSVAFFITQERLVNADTDSVFDVYQRSGTTTKRVSTGQLNGSGAFPASYLGASTNGKRVLFSTAEALVGTDLDGAIDIYERFGGVTTLISAGAINGNGAFNADFRGMSADGTRVFFHSNEALTADDGDAVQDVYERAGGVTTLLSPGDVGPGSVFRHATADGTRVFFTNADKVVASDKDSTVDVYMALLAP